jgi:hypothetical protein
VDRAEVKGMMAISSEGWVELKGIQTISTTQAYHMFLSANELEWKKGRPEANLI